MKVFKDVCSLIGGTPLLELNNVKKEFNLSAKVFAKLEYFNPAGSVKDRPALFMIEDAENKGLLKKGGTVIEPTSGNTGIGLASICASKGYKLILTMPNTMSVERIKLLKAYGATVILTDGALGMKGAIEKAKEINEGTENSIIIGQFDNPINPISHYKTTAREIYNDLDGKVDIFIATVGSGGTISGIGKYLKEQNPNVKIIAVEPFNSPLISKGYSGAHKIQGIGANFIPKNYDANYVDEVVTVKEEDAFRFAKLVAKKEGILVGISSGAVLSAMVEIANHNENKEKNIVALFPDGGDRYLSTELFNE